MENTESNKSRNAKPAAELRMRPQSLQVVQKNPGPDGSANPEYAGLNLEGRGGSGILSSSPAPAGSSSPHHFRINSSESEGRWYKPLVYCESLPKGALIVLATNSLIGKMMKGTDWQPTSQQKKVAEQFKNFKKHSPELKGIDLSVFFLRDACMGSYVIFDDVFVSKNKPVDILIWIWSSEWDPEKEYSYDFVQWQEQNAVGRFKVLLKGLGAKKVKGK